jgi:hypothetical protein
MADKADTKKPRRNWKKAYLEALQNSANVRAACQAASVSRASAYEAYHKDAKFAAQWDEALEGACDILEARAWERSKTSDAVLMFLLRAHRPQKYTEKIKNEISGELGLKAYVGISPDQWDEETQE